MDSAVWPEPTSIPARRARGEDSVAPAPVVKNPEAAELRPFALKSWEPPGRKRRAKAADVIRPGIDLSLEMVEQMIDDGIEIRTARTITELAALWTSRPKLGRPTEAPRLTDRNPRARKDGRPGRRMARIVYCEKYETTGIPLKDGEDPKEHKGAQIFLRCWKKDLANKVLGRLVAPTRTMSEVFKEILNDLDPGTTQDPAFTGPYKRWLSDASQLEEYLGDLVFAELPGNIADLYLLWRIQQQIKNQSPDHPTPRLVDPATADSHNDTLFFLIGEFCKKHFLPERSFKRRKIRRKPVRFLSFWQLWKIIRYCRGFLLDAAGRIVGRHGMAAKYECVLRFVLIYVYGGTRKKNIHQLIWGMDTHLGHIDVRAGEIQRQGPEARVTNKRRLPSGLIGSLRTLAPRWFAKDMAARKALSEEERQHRYVHILHDESGYQLPPTKINALLGEVCAAVGIRKVNAHSLKHTGVTLVSRAYMPLQDLEEAYSTSFFTLLTTYRHLQGKWFSRHLKPFDPKHLNMLFLRRFALQDRDEIYGAA